MERLDAYIRVSRVAGREGPSYISPSVQRDAISGWATRNGVEIAAWHQDEDWSGGSTRRPGLDLAVQRAVAGETSGIVSANVDRFSRHTEQGLADLRRLKDAGARLVFVAESLDVSGPVGMLQYTLMLAQATYFLEQIKAAWINAKTRAIGRGAHIGPTPIGYQRNGDGTLSPSPDAPHITEAFRLAAAGNLAGARRHLSEHFPGRTWENTHARRLLANRTYLGEVRYGELAQPDAHPPLVSRAIWEAAQSSPATRKPNETFALSGVLSCANCGSPMVGGRGGKGQRTYRCSGRCARAAVITATLVEDHVRGVLAELLAQLPIEVGHPEADALALAERELAEAEAELEAFAADLMIRRALAGRYHQFLQARVDAVEEAKQRYAALAGEAETLREHLAPDALQRPETLAALCRGMFASILVARGRDAVGERVELVPANADGASGIQRPEVVE